MGLGVALLLGLEREELRERGRPLAALGGLLLLDGGTQRRLDLVARLGVGRGGRRGVAGLGEVGAPRVGVSRPLLGRAGAALEGLGAQALLGRRRRQREHLGRELVALGLGRRRARLERLAARRVRGAVPVEPRAQLALARLAGLQRLAQRRRGAVGARRGVLERRALGVARGERRGRVARGRLGGLEPGLGVPFCGLGRNRARLGGLEARGRVRALGRGARARGRGLAAVLAEAPALGGVGGLGPGLGLGGVALGREQRRARVGRVRGGGLGLALGARDERRLLREGAPRVGGVEARRVALGRHLAQEPLEAARLGLGARAVGARARAQEGELVAQRVPLALRVARPRVERRRPLVSRTDRALDEARVAHRRLL